MSSNNIIRQPRGPRKGNEGDAAAVPLIAGRMLYSAKSDALNGNVVEAISRYHREALAWFHIGVRERPFLFMLPATEDKEGAIGRRPDFFRTEAGDHVNKMIRLSVAGQLSAAARLTSEVRKAAEEHLADCLFASLTTYVQYTSEQHVIELFEMVERDRSFSGLLTDARFKALGGTKRDLPHEDRLYQFAMLTTGLCS